jgi:hypothetical protein
MKLLISRESTQPPSTFRGVEKRSGLAITGHWARPFEFAEKLRLDLLASGKYDYHRQVAASRDE